MPADRARLLKFVALKVFRWLGIYRGIWGRALVCFVIAIVATIVNEQNQFDHRLTLRRPQPFDHSIVLVLMNRTEWVEMQHFSHNFLKPMKDLSAVNDSFFWNAESWIKILGKILAGHPKAIGVTLFFDADSPVEKNLRNSPILKSENIIWAADEDNFGRPLMPLLADSYGYNAGLRELQSDQDHVVRRFSNRLIQIPNLVYRLIGTTKPLNQNQEMPTSDSKLINFRGPAQTFPSVSIRQILLPDFSVDFFKNRTVIIGVKDSDNHSFNTPVGEMTRAEIDANVLDNILNNRWVRTVPYWMVGTYLLFILSLVIWLLFQYPQTLSLTVLIALCLGHVTLSLWIFDRFNFWLPLLSPLIEIFAAYVVFVGYQLTLKEKLAWRLEQEQKNLYELDTMKGNFVSLISHDLKTPIAKIQAICDRLVTKNLDGAVNDGLRSIRKESVELHRYIQSILQISRVESKTMKLHREGVDINTVIERVAEILKPLACEKSIEIELQLEPLFAIEADEGLIREVVLNLAENAIKYSGSGSKVVIRSHEQNDFVQVTVTDRGPGIAKKEQALIFDKFYRGREHALSTKGTGLGLYLVKYFIELHGGNVFVESSLGVGTTVGFRVPIETP